MKKYPAAFTRYYRNVHQAFPSSIPQWYSLAIKNVAYNAWRAGRRLGVEPAVLHSGLSDVERLRAWRAGRRLEKNEH
jgi:hypothetical protein